MSKRYLETIKSVDGKLLYLEYHQKRLDVALETSGIHNLQSILQPPSLGTYRCRVLYDKESCFIEYLKYQKRDIKKLKVVLNDVISYEKKYADRRDLEKILEQKEDCDDVLIVKNGFVTDTTIANIAFYDGEKWLTPKKPLLFGTTRARLLEMAKIVERDIQIEEIYKYQKVALMNAMIDFDIIAVENIGEIIC